MNALDMEAKASAVVAGGFSPREQHVGGLWGPYLLRAVDPGHYAQQHTHENRFSCNTVPFRSIRQGFLCVTFSIGSAFRRGEKNGVTWDEI